MNNIAFREYGDFFVVYSADAKKYFLIKDIYAVFFRNLYLKNMTQSEIVHTISCEYDVEPSVVQQDLAHFCKEINDALHFTNASVVDSSAQEFHAQQIYDIMAQSLIPFSATIEITDSCNLKCLHCYRGDANLSYWTVENFSNVLRELKSLGTMNLTITGGEPFSHPHICQFLELVKQYGFVLSIQSNAILLSDEILSTLKENIVSDVSVSLYSTVDSQHDFITQSSGSAQKTIANIKRLIDNHIPVSINCPVMKYNSDAMPSLRKFAADFGIDVKFALKIIPSQDKSRHIEDYNIFSKDYILAAIENPSIRLYQKELDNIRNSKPAQRYCQTGFRSVTFDAQGNMLICNAYRKKCGSLQNSNIKELWTTSNNLNLWREHTSLVIEKCLDCPAYAYCEPCPAHAYTLTGSEVSIDETTCQFGKAFYAADMEHNRKGVL